MKRHTRAMLAVGATAAMLLPSTADAHPDTENDGALHDNKHSLHDAQDHDSDSEGHIAQDVNYGLRPIGHDTLGGVAEGRYTDVWADGRGFAYVGSFEEPACDRAGVFISDIRDPANPELVAQIKSPPNTRVNDVKTIAVGGRTVLIHTLEPCGKTVPSGDKGQGGISLWDVTNPRKPHALKQNFLDFPVHNTFPWTDVDTGKTYLIGVNDVELLDVFFVDISKPQSPKLLSEVGLPNWPGAQDEQSAGMGNFAASFNHDVWVADLGGGNYQAVVSYWDAGFVTLDVNDPSAPGFVDDSTYPDPDPITGFSPPEGNGHAGAYNAGATQLFAGDEDFSGFRTTFNITGGPNAGEYPAAEGAFTSPIADLADESMNGSSTYVGLACGGTIPTAPEDGNPLTEELAVIQRGGCTFQLKADTAEAAGYDGFIVFNDAERGDALVTMGGDGSLLPGIFVGHSTGLAIFDVADASELNIGDTGAATASSVVFDGFGYFHLLDRATLSELGYYAPGQVNDPDYASGFGDLTMHNVEGNAVDRNQAFISWYSLGMRVVDVNTGNSVRPPADDWDQATPPVNDYYGKNVTEVGRFIAPEGSNFWGVTQTVIEGQRYVLGSDRNTGLWIFQVDPTYCDAAAGYSCP